MTKLRYLPVAGLALGMAIAGAATNANAVALIDLINNDGFIIDEDKRFDNFSCSVVGAGLTAGGCGTINVLPLAGDTGLRFQDAFLALNAGSVLDILIGYTVTVLDPNKEIESITLAFNGSFAGVAATSVTETATEPGVGVTGQAAVFNPPPILSVEVFLDETATTLDILKDIQLVTFSTPGQATISFIDQDFHQTGVPEPASLGLLGLGLLAMGSLARGRRRSA